MCNFGQGESYSTNICIFTTTFIQLPKINNFPKPYKCELPWLDDQRLVKYFLLYGSIVKEGRTGVKQRRDKPKKMEQSKYKVFRQKSAYHPPYMAKTWYSIFQSKTRTCVFLNGQNREAPRLDSSPMTKTRKGPRLDSSPMTKTRKGPRLDSSPMAKTRKRPLQGQVQYFTKTWSQAPVLNRNELWPTESQDFLLEDF